MLSREFTVKLIPQACAAMETTAARLGLSDTDVINRALQFYAFFEEAAAGGAKVFLSSPDGDLSQVKFG